MNKNQPPVIDIVLGEGGAGGKRRITVSATGAAVAQGKRAAAGKIGEREHEAGGAAVRVQRVEPNPGRAVGIDKKFLSGERGDAIVLGGI